MKELCCIFNSLKENKTVKGKQEILLNNRENKVFIDVIKFVYNPFIVTGLAKKKMNKKFDSSLNNVELKSIIEVMEYLRENNTGTNNDIANIQGFMEMLDTDEEKKMVVSIVTKDIKVGMTSSTINKTYGKGFIPEYSTQLAVKYDPDKHNKRLAKDGFVITPKIDGNRACFRCEEDGSIVGYTRTGKPYEGLGEIVKDLESLPKGFVYDGEIVANEDPSMDSKELFALTQSILRKDGEKTGLEFLIFDIIPIDEFDMGESSKTYTERRIDLDRLDKEYCKDLSSVRIVKWWRVSHNVDDIQELLDIAESKGLEGIMLNVTTSKYKTKRHNELIKVKSFSTIDLRCIGVLDHNKNEDMIGALEVDYKGYTVQVGSGLNDEDRRYFKQHPEKVVGSIIEVKYFEESKNKDGGLSLRFPTFIGVRADKDEVSYD